MQETGSASTVDANRFSLQWEHALVSGAWPIPFVVVGRLMGWRVQLDSYISWFIVKSP